MASRFLRGFIPGLVAVAIVCWVVTFAESVSAKIQIGFLQLPPVVLGFLVILVGINIGVRRLSKRFALDNSDIVVIYSMMLIAAMVSSRGLMEKVMPALIAPDYYANPANEWQKLFFPYIKKWMVAFNPSGGPQQLVATRYYEKLRAGESIPWGAWAVPLVAWGVFALLIFGCFLCLASILRRQWVDNEKLAFPLAQLPLDMLKEGQQGSLFRNRLLWIGFAIPTAVFAMNGLHNLIPNIPSVQLQQNLTSYLPPVAPYLSVYSTTAYLSFAGIGLFYLLPSDILFSLWAFFVFMRFQTYIAGVYGLTVEQMPIYPCYKFMGYQAMGAYITLAAYMVYTSWPYLKKVWKNATGRRELDDSNELLPYWASVWGLLIFFVLATMWLHAAGMDLWLAAFELFVFIFVVGLVLTRSVSEGGLLMTETSFRPVDIIRVFAPPASLGAQNLTAMAFMDTAFLRDQRGLLLSGFLDSLKISDGVSIRRRTFLPLFVVAIVLAALVSGYLQMYYTYLAKGALNLYSYAYSDNATWSFNDYQEHIRAISNGITPDPARASNAFWLGTGVLFTVFLAWMRINFFWWPLHPLGYALAPSWTMYNFWFPCFVAWVFKSLILRYGGMKLYLKARPVFLGLIMGEFLSAILWTAISAILNSPAPQFPWP
ncbi:MAG: hypothetical protein IT209_01120 [Armatimonadetes bacterium]|nr:hypothetical protein [Armatimonadota bacterium]